MIETKVNSHPFRKGMAYSETCVELKVTGLTTFVKSCQFVGGLLPLHQELMLVSSSRSIPTPVSRRVTPFGSQHCGLIQAWNVSARCSAAAILSLQWLEARFEFTCLLLWFMASWSNRHVQEVAILTVVLAWVSPSPFSMTESAVGALRARAA